VTNLNASGPGSLPFVVANAPAGATVTFAVNGTITLTATIDLNRDITIDGSGTSVTVNGGGSVQVFNVQGGVTATLRQLTIADGNAITGGGIDNAGTLIVANSTISDNNAGEDPPPVAGSGGGIENQGTLTITNSTISNNGATGGVDDIGGGGGGIDNGGALTITSSTISDNGAAGGGGIANEGTLTITNSTFSDNVADAEGTGAGGAIANGGTLSVANSTFRGNGTDELGGAIDNFSTLSVANSTFGGNGASQGGAIYNTGTVNVANSTFGGNSGLGGGIDNDFGGTLSVANSTFSGNGGGDIENVSTLNLANTILANPSGYDCDSYAGTVIVTTDGGGNLADDDSCGFTSPSSANDVTNLDLDPNGLQNNGGPTQTIALEPGSRAIGAGVVGVCQANLPTTAGAMPPYGAGGVDQRGRARAGLASAPPYCDSGAYDSGLVPQPTATATSTSTSTPTPSATVTSISTATPSVTRTSTPAGPTSTHTPKPTNTITLTPTSTATPSVTRTSTPTNAGTATPTSTLTATHTPKPTSTGTVTPGGPTLTPTITLTATHTPRPTSTGTVTPGGPTYSPTITLTATHTPRPTSTGTVTPGGPTSTATLAPTNTATPGPAGVVTSLNASGPGSLPFVVANAPNGATVTFAVSGTITLTGTIDLNQDITIDGSGKSVTVDGDGSVQVFYIGAVTAALKNITIVNGAEGIYNDGGILSLIDSTVSDNTTPGNGGGIYNSDGTVTVTNSTLKGNSALYGGGIFNSFGTVTVTNSTLSGNDVPSSGIGGQDTGDGGAIDNSQGTLTVINSTLSGNTALNGGGIANEGTLTVINSTFSGNSAGTTGLFGEISGQGGGIYNSNGALMVTNTILAATAIGGDCFTASGLIDNGGNLADDASCGFTASSSANSVTTLNLDPRGLRANGGPTQTIALSAGSAAIGHGVPTYCADNLPTATGAVAPYGAGGVDQRGFTRAGLTNGTPTCDSGAYDTGDPVQLTPTRTATSTATATRSATPGGPTSTPTATHAPKPTNTSTPGGPISTSTPTPSATATSTSTATPSVTRTGTPVVPTSTHTPKPTSTGTVTPGGPTLTPTITLTATHTPKPTSTSTVTPSTTRTSTTTSTGTATPSVTRTSTPTNTSTATPTSTLTATHTPKPTSTGTVTPGGPTLTPTITLTATHTPKPTSTGTPSSTVTATPSSTATAGTLRLAIPSYFDPPSPLWTQLDQGAPTVGLAVINPDSGPGASFSAAYAAQVQDSQIAGITVLGYVHTQYGQRSLATVEAEIDTYYTWYHPDGIFVDEVDNTSCAMESSYYLPLYRAIKAKGGKAVVVLNPGSQTQECYMAAGDIVINFEGSESDYVTSYVSSAPGWLASYPASRFWHIVYGTPTIAALQQVVALAGGRDAGWLWVTDAPATPNPYGSLPDTPFWTAELAAVQAAS
jgi:hypothetical protein